MKTVEELLREAGWELPPAPKPVAAYVPATRSGNLVFVSGQLPTRDGKLVCAGAVGGAVSLEQAQQASALCAVNALAVLKGELGGDWSKLVRIVRLAVFVQAAAGFAQHPQVANGASELLVRVLGERGRHARAAIGCSSLPLDAPVELELLAEIA